jgi:radical SAM protein with 4Fe4S-binding SPASM domain
MDHRGLSFIQLYTTLRCNQGCLFCFNRSISDAGSYKDMHDRDAYKLIELLSGAGIREIDLLGGEPMLISWTEDFARRVVDSGVALNISTNGTFPDFLDRLCRVRTDLINIGVSLHGFSGTHNDLVNGDNFFRAVAGIERIMAYGKAPIVKSVLTRYNMDEVPRLVRYLGDLGVQKYFLLYEDIIGRREMPPKFSYPEFMKFYNGLEEEFAGTMDMGFVAASGFYKHGKQSAMRCDAGTRKIALMPDGSVFPCNLFSGFREFCLGNIFRDGLDKILNDPILDYFRRYKGNNACELSDCEYHSACSGGCPAHSYYYFGTLDAVDPRCRETRGKV